MLFISLLFFFFFKQKTAYELRISDWSSDVCSSDLVGRRINMMETVLDIPEQDVITRDNASVKVDAIVFYQVVDARRAAYEVRELDRALTNLALTNIRSVLGSTDLDEALSSRDRSEEHTSELPSLMRISYAVFCLKK